MEGGGSFRRQDRTGGNESQDLWLQNVCWYHFLTLPSVHKEASQFIPPHLLHCESFHLHTQFQKQQGKMSVD